MKTHHGQIVEYIIRKKGINIAELARLLGVNRRSLYNWFADKELKIGIIYRIGIAVRHDFSKEFPDFFNEEHFKSIKFPREKYEFDTDILSPDIDSLWRERYIALLEKYNSFLTDYPPMKN
jgi:AcrR family transcriptional regulator